MASKVIRIWNDCKVLAVLEVGDDATSFQARVGGAASALMPDVELDPFAGLIVAHGSTRSAVLYEDRDEDDEDL